MSARRRGARRQRGFALLAAIFLLVVLGGLSLYMLSLSGTQHFTGMWAAEGARAHYAAQGMLQFAARQVTSGQPCPGPQQVDGGGGRMIDVTVTCNGSTYTEFGVPHTVWQIDVLASRGSIGEPGFVQRRQQATVVQ